VHPGARFIGKPLTQHELSVELDAATVRCIIVLHGQMVYAAKHVNSVRGELSSGPAAVAMGEN
jgi:hypothetical protein